MKNIASLFLALIVACTTYNQESTSLDGEQILIGTVNLDGFYKPPYKDWFAPNYVNYQVDSVNLRKVKSTIQEIEIIMFMGTWCSDSQLQVPQFYKMLDYIEYNYNNMSVIALEKKETGKLESPQHEEAEYAITHVPTFIFLKDGAEIGRITEYPNKTIEKDMVEIILN